MSTLNLSREEWLQYRKAGIGGSDAGAICGLNPYRTAMQVYQDKISDACEDIDNEAMRQGREFEDYVARRFMEATGKKVRRANAMFRSKNHPFMLADVDRMIVGEMPDWNVKQPVRIWKTSGKMEKFQCHIRFSAIIIWRYAGQTHGISQF